VFSHNMTKMTFALLVLLTSACSAAAQDGFISASNKIEVWIEDSLRASEYLNQFDVIYSNENWQIGARLETDEETRWDDQKETELVRRYAEYSDEYLLLRGGNFYATFGRGLLLRAMEDDDVRIDRDIDGVYGQATWNRLEGQGFFGRPRNDETKLREHLLSGVDLSIQATDEVTFGGGYVRLDADDLTEDMDEDLIGRPLEELAGARFGFVRGAFDFYFEGARRFMRGQPDPRDGYRNSDADDGQAIYTTANLSLPGYAFLLEYKDYEDFNFLYSTTPACNRDGTPLNDGADERGFGFLATMSPAEALTIELNASFADSRNTDPANERTAAGGTIRREWFSQGTVMLGAEYVEELEINGYNIREWTGPTFEFSRYLTENMSLQLKGHYYDRTDQWDYFEGVSDGVLLDYTEYEADITLAHSSAKSVTFNVIKASEPHPKYDYDDTWISVALTMALSYKHELTLKIGEERGGITCSGGICRYEDPFTGIRLELVSRL
jgi:Family of unknown function (DUF6029)